MLTLWPKNYLGLSKSNSHVQEAEVPVGIQYLHHCCILQDVTGAILEGPVIKITTSTDMRQMLV